MSWVRSAIVICLVALLAGCGVSSGSASSSSEQHGLLPSGRVYHAITTTPEHGVEVSVMGTFADKDIERIAGALRPV